MSEKWIKARLDSIGDVVAGGTPLTGNEEYWGGDVSFITPADLSRVTGSTIEITERTISECGLRNSAANLLPPSSIVISTRAPIGYIALTIGKSATNQGCKSVVLNECQFPLFHCYNIHRYVSEMWRLGVGTTFSEISKSDLSRISVVYPKDQGDQRHIAEVLATCDEVIEQSERAAEKYRQIKAGMLKDLLTRGINNRGKLRPPPSVAPELYKDSELGPIPKEWEVKRLGDVCQAPQYGLNVAATEYDGIHGYIRITDIDDNSHRFNHGGITSPENYSDFYKLEEGDMVISRTGASVGKAYVYDRRDGQLYFAGFLIRFRCNRDVDSRFVFSQLLTGRYWNWVAAMSVRTGQPGINSQEYAKYRFAMPMEALEQRAIAERLAAVDERIAAEVKTAEKYRKVKAGLMEKLLTPPVDAEIEDLTQEVAG